MNTFLTMLAETSATDIYSVLTILGFTIIVGTIFGKLIEKIKLPAVTGYIIAGIILGPVTHIITTPVKSSLEVISNVAIGFIAFSIGTELWLPKFKKSGKSIIIITIVQALLTFFVVTGLILLTTQKVYLALTLGAIATATAPAPIMMIIKRYEGKGELTDTLIPVTGLDDAVGIIVFGVCLSIATSSCSGVAINVMTALVEPLLEILFSCGIGAVIGLALGFVAKYIIYKYDKNEKRSSYLGLIIVVVFLSVVFSHNGIPFGNFLGIERIAISSILMPMMAGVVFTNMINKENFRQQAKATDIFTAPLMVAFFTLAGADLDFSILAGGSIILISLLYVVGRSIGKICGAYAGGKLSKSSKNVTNHLGLTLLPQGGVEIGLVISVVAAFAALNSEVATEAGKEIQTIVIIGIFIFEIVGPVLTKYFLEKNGELHYKDKKGEDMHF